MSGRLPVVLIERAAEAIVNARGGRRGVPPVTGILKALPERLREEVMEDAEAALLTAVTAAITAATSSSSADRYDYSRIDPLVRESLDAYAETGRPTGQFLASLLSNDLFAACARADNENVWTIPIVTAYVYNHLPGECWGSPAAVRAWIKQRGLAGSGYPADAPLPDAPGE